MSTHFNSVLSLIAQPQASELEDVEKVARVKMKGDGRSIELLENQARPTKRPVYPFHRIFPPEECSDEILYRHSVKEIVDAALMGYHGTVISLSVGKVRKEEGFDIDRVVCKAARQILRTLRKSRGSPSSQSSAALIVSLSCFMLHQEKTYDLLYGYQTEEAAEERTLPLVNRDAPSTVTILNGQVVGASEHEAKSAAGVSSLLHFAHLMQEAILAESSQQFLHHTVVIITVEFAQFGSLRAPVSGNLSFVELSSTAPLTDRQRYTCGESIHATVRSLFSFADLIQALTTSESYINHCQEQDEHTPERLSTRHLDHSVLTQLLRESLGGNCKTLLICSVPMSLTLKELEEATVAVSLASSARLIVNSPNKRDLAERALMSAYMKELSVRYGNTTKVRALHAPVANPPAGKKSHLEELVCGSCESMASASAEFYDACGQLSSLSDKELRDKDIEVAAAALAAAATCAEDDEGSSEEEQEAVYETESLPKCDSSQPTSSEYDVLISVLQDPDIGVPRAQSSALKDVRIRRDAGAVFSGAEIVHWLQNIFTSVGGEMEAEQLGQLLLERGYLIHSEGSMHFANADSLFYYARKVHQQTKELSREDLEALLVELRREQLSESGRDSEKEQMLGELCENEIQQGTDTTASSEWQPAVQEAYSCENSHTPTLSSTTAISADNKEDCSSGGGGRNIGGVDANHHSVEKHMLNEEIEQPEAGWKAVEPDTAPLLGIPSMNALEATTAYPHPLHMAAAVGKRPGVLKNLIMMFGVDAQDEYGRTPLMFAALGNKRTSCSTLLECSAEVDSQDHSGLTALHVACYHGSKDVLGVLLGRHASLSIFDRMGHSCLHWASVPASSKCMEQLLRHPSTDLINHVDHNKLTPLHWAIYYNRPEHLSLLMKRWIHSIVVQAELTFILSTPTGVLRALVVVGRYSTHRCATFTLWEDTELSCLHPNRYDHPLEFDAAGRTLMTYVIQCKANKCIKVLLALCPALSALSDAQSCSPLHYASMESSSFYLHELLSQSECERTSLDLSVKDQQLRTPLHYAVAWKRTENVKLLLGGGASVLMLDCDNCSPLDYATSLPDGSDVLAILQDAAAAAAGTDMGMEREQPTTAKSRLCAVI